MTCPFKFIYFYTYDKTKEVNMTRVDIDGEVAEDEYNPDIKNPLIKNG